MKDSNPFGEMRRRRAVTLLICGISLLLLGGVIGARFVRGASLLPQSFFAAAAKPSPSPTQTGEYKENGMAEASPSIKEEEPAPTAAPALLENGEDYVQTAVLVDGEPVGVLASRQAAEEVLREAVTYFESLILQPGMLDSAMENEVLVIDAADPAAAGAEPLTYEEMFALLTGEDTPICVKTTVTQRNVELIPHETETEKDKNLVTGTRVVVTYGGDGETHAVTQTRYENGKAQGEGETTTVVVSEKENALIREGIQKVDEDASPGKREGAKGPSKGELSFIRPIHRGEITQNFGQLAGVLHLGLDFKATLGDEVLASCAGEAVCVMERGGYGLMIELDHGNGFVTRYAHLESAAVKLGDVVEQGQLIGTAGASGNVKTPVLHFELRIDSIPFNPRYYLE